MRFLLELLTLCSTTMTTFSQAVLFPHGYFDMNRLSAKDALYLNLMALSSIEYGGITEKELQQEIEESGLYPKAYVRTTTPNPETTFEPSRTELQSTRSGFIEQHFANFKEFDFTMTPAATTPRSPFKRLHDDVFGARDIANPFEDIATRAPPGSSFYPTLLPRPQIENPRPYSGLGERTVPEKQSDSSRQILNYSQLVGVYPSSRTERPNRVSQRGDTERIAKMPSEFVAPMRRPNFVGIDFYSPTVVALPVPPPLDE